MYLRNKQEREERNSGSFSHSGSNQEKVGLGYSEHRLDVEGEGEGEGKGETEEAKEYNKHNNTPPTLTRSALKKLGSTAALSPHNSIMAFAPSHLIPPGIELRRQLSGM